MDGLSSPDESYSFPQDRKKLKNNIYIEDPRITMNYLHCKKNTSNLYGILLAFAARTGGINS